MVRRFGCILFLAAGLWAQSEPGGSTAGRVMFDAGLQGSTSSVGTVTRLDAAAGYQFNQHWSFELGVPFYFISPSSTTGGTATEGLGNVYGQARFVLINPAVNYAATLTGTAPTGDPSKGLSTGHATVDLSNYFDHGFGRLTPFGEIGFANAVSDTQFFIRPYTTYGFVTHLQAGARFRITRWISMGGAGYDIEPMGQQTVVSRVVTVQKQNQQASTSLLAVGHPPATSNPPGAPNSPGTPSLPVPALTNSSGKPAFETTTVTTGAADIARDRGVSAWVLLGSGRPVDLQLGYTHSMTFNLDTLFFGVGFHLRKPLASMGL